MKKAALGGCCLVALLVALSATAGMRQNGQVCNSRWCFRPPTRTFHAEPNSPHHPRYHFCDRCYDAFLEPRSEFYLHVDLRWGRVIVGKQQYENGEFKSGEMRAYEIFTPWW
jgi:hypothetical protein